MFKRAKLFTCLIAGLLLVGGSAASRAVTLDWDAVTWTDGSLNNSLDVDPAHPGNDVTVTVSGDTAILWPELISPYPQTPAVTRDFDGGLSPGEKTLSLAVNFTDQSQAITVTVDFSAVYTQGVTNVSFTIFDVDFDNAAGVSTYQDQLNSITALSIDGTTLIAPTIIVSANNTLSGTDVNQVVNGNLSTTDLGAGSGSANVTISFGGAAIQSFTFTYGSGSGTVADPTYQHIGLHDVSFTPVPEINPAWGAALSCISVAFIILRHNARHRK